MYFDTVVQVPDPKKLSSFNTIKLGVSYAYYTLSSFYDPSKKYSCPKRVCIGKIVDKQLGLVQPNHNFFQLFPVELPLERSDTLSFLPYIVMIEEAKQIGLYKPLKKHFPDQFLDILALVLFNLCEEDLIADRFFDFHFHCFDGLDKVLLSSYISKLYTNLGLQEDKIQAFFQDFLVSYREEMGLAQEAILDIDSTNFSTTGDILLASPGFNKDHTRRPCVGQLIITDRETGIPLYCEEYNGSLLDKTQGSILVDLLEEKGFKSGLLCIDAGFWNQNILKTLEKKEDRLNYIIRVPEHATAFKELVDIF
ncbi:MAG: transposase, partial [Allobaculum sp.]|nr:transposase [Allobaculum sp.]